MSIRPAIPRTNLTELNRQGFAALVAELGEPAYRADQLHGWVFKRGARSIDEMSNLPKRMRTALTERGYTVGRVELGQELLGAPLERALAVVAGIEASWTIFN